MADERLAASQVARRRIGGGSSADWLTVHRGPIADFGEGAERAGMSDSGLVSRDA
jgi:hypothetical protein